MHSGNIIESVIVCKTRRSLVLLITLRAMRRVITYLIPIVVCLVVGFMAAPIQQQAIQEWYPTLTKSVLTPPNIVFPIVWTILYILMGLSLGRLLEIGRTDYLWLWVVQLILNFMWSIGFFYFHNTIIGFVDIIILIVLAVWYMVAVRRISRTAAWLFLPYAVWLLFAAYLNSYIVIANP